MSKNSSKKRGFTLIELMTALSIFAVVVTISLTSILGVFNANRKSRALRVVMTDINQALENVSREMRYGSRYHCGSGDVTQPQNCSVSGDSTISFLSDDGVQYTYRMNGSTFEKQIGTSGDWLPVIPPEVTIDTILFFVTGAGPSDGLQPSILMKMTAHSGTGTGRTDISLQTLISQRTLDT